MQKVQQEQEELDLDTISAWGNKRTSIPMLKEHLTPPQYVMVQELKRGLSCEKNRGWREPSKENNARQARIIRGLLKLTALAEGCRRESRQQSIVQAEVRLRP